MPDNQANRKFHEVIEVVGLYRGMILDAVEQELHDSPRWNYLRARLLKCLGERGLEGRIREILDQQLEN